MSLKMVYKNELGEVVMYGGGTSPLRILEAEGLGLTEKEYSTAVYSGYDGQQTLNSRAVARTVTIALEAIGDKVEQTVKNALRVFGESGMLYIYDGDIKRRIRCNQAYISDVTRVLRKRIAQFAVQLVCDNPYFEDAEDTVIPLYRRTKRLSSPFTLPEKFGEIILGGTVTVTGTVPIEPVITLYYPTALESAEGIVITNKTTGKSIRLDYKPETDDTVTVDVKNRRVTSSVAGNVINCISDETFLGDFVFLEGNNIISVDVGDVEPDFTAECRYNNLYSEAVIV